MLDLCFMVCLSCLLVSHTLCHFPPSFHFTRTLPASNLSPLRFPAEMAKWNAPHLAEFSRDSLKFHHFNKPDISLWWAPKIHIGIPHHFPFPIRFFIHPHPKSTPSLPKPTLVRCGEPGGEGLGTTNFQWSSRDGSWTPGLPPAGVPRRCNWWGVVVSADTYTLLATQRRNS